MFPEEAIKLLNQLVAPHSEHLDALRAAKDALEMQIAEQPSRHFLNAPVCPNCIEVIKGDLDDIIKYTHCPYCGKAISVWDWQIRIENGEVEMLHFSERLNRELHYEGGKWIE